MINRQSKSTKPGATNSGKNGKKTINGQAAVRNAKLDAVESKAGKYTKRKPPEPGPCLRFREYMLSHKEGANNPGQFY